jgi:acyl carrier protein phosphodiesterase
LTERSKPFCAGFVLAQFFRGINADKTGEDTETSRSVILVDFFDHFQFAGWEQDVDCQLPEFVDHCASERSLELKE